MQMTKVTVKAPNATQREKIYTNIEEFGYWIENQKDYACFKNMLLRLMGQTKVIFVMKNKILS
jgi:hypothetical protein